MGNETAKQLLEYRYKPKHAQFTGTTKLTIGDKSYEVAPWNHPASLAKSILNWIIHTVFYGVYIVAPMGHGKTTIAQTIAHWIHKKDPSFRIQWAGEHEFTHQETFFQGLPKVPHCIIFDDISGALKQLNEKQIEANFASLTRVRWILDPVSGRIPVVVIVVGHYSKNLEKEFRAQLGMSIYAAFGNEERTNLDTIAEKGSDAYKTLKQFGDMYSDMFEKHHFKLYLPNGHGLEYKTDDPFRCVAAISKTKGKIILYSKHDVCSQCVKKKTVRLVSAKEVIKVMEYAYQKNGIKALQFAMLKRGFTGGVQARFAAANDYFEQKVAPVYDFDYNEMVKEIRALKHWTSKKTVYHKRKAETEGIDELDKVAVVQNHETNDAPKPIDTIDPNPHP